MAVITVTGEYGTESGQVAAVLASKTGYDHIGEQLQREIAERLRLSESEVEMFRKAAQSRIVRLMDRYTCSLVKKLVDRGRGCLDDRDFYRAASELVEKLYQAGDVVIHDWGAQCILRGRPDSVHVLLKLDPEAKVRTAMKRHRLDFGAARRLVLEQEQNSAQYIRQFFDADWQDRRLYDLVIDRQNVSVEKAARMIADHLAKESAGD